MILSAWSVACRKQTSRRLHEAHQHAAQAAKLSKERRSALYKVKRQAEDILLPQSYCQARFIQHEGISPLLKAVDNGRQQLHMKLIGTQIDSTQDDVELTFDYGPAYPYVRFNRFGT